MRVAYWVAQYTLGIIDAPAVAAKAMLTHAGMPETVMASRCDDLFRRYVAVHVCDRGREAVERHRSRGDTLAIVTGASPYAARPLARMLGIEHIVASELEVGEDGRFTGRFVPPLCYGEGKIVRTSRLAEALGFELRDATFYSGLVHRSSAPRARGRAGRREPGPALVARGAATRVARRRVVNYVLRMISLELPLPLLDPIVDRALAEDLASGDVTTEACIDARWGDRDARTASPAARSPSPAARRSSRASSRGSILRSASKRVAAASGSA